MDIDIRTLLIISIVIIGLIFIMIFPILDSNSNQNIAETNTIEIASTKRNSIKNNVQITSNTTEKFEDTTENFEEADSEKTLEENTEDIVEEITEPDTNTINSLAVSKLEKNNPYPKLYFNNENEKYLGRSERYTNLNANCSLEYKIPESWVTRKGSFDGRYTNSEGYMLSYFGVYNENEITYEEFLNIFMEKEKANDTFSDYVEFRIRDLAISAYDTFPIIEKTSYNTIENYMVLIKDKRVFVLCITFPTEEYSNEELLYKMDNVFKSTYLSY